MDVRDAVATRFSCRAFRSTPVPLAVVRDILQAMPVSGSFVGMADAFAGMSVEVLVTS